MPMGVPGGARAQRQFLILHGWQNRQPPEHWQARLAQRLRRNGHLVGYPQLPSPDEPDLKEWLTVIEEQLGQLYPTELTVVCHSLACVAWSQLALSGSVRLPVDRVLFVAPPSPDFVASEPALRDFQFTAEVFGKVAGTARHAPRLVCSANDPYCPPVAANLFTDGFQVDLVPGAGHFDLAAGYGRWRSVRRWCEDPRRRITGR